VNEGDELDLGSRISGVDGVFLQRSLKKSWVPSIARSRFNSLLQHPLGREQLSRVKHASKVVKRNCPCVTYIYTYRIYIRYMYMYIYIYIYILYIYIYIYVYVSYLSCLCWRNPDCRELIGLLTYSSPQEFFPARTLTRKVTQTRM